MNVTPIATVINARKMPTRSRSASEIPAPTRARANTQRRSTSGVREGNRYCQIVSGGSALR